MAAVKTTRRDTYKSFWDKYSDKPDNGAMMLNKNADEIEELDRYDILSSLPDFTNKNVVDIGAGIGRFTTIFSNTAKHVTSTDFIESFIEKNKERNSNFKNIKYVVSDAAHLTLPHHSYDLVFTNWLLMYMTDYEVVEFIVKALKWLKPNGHLKLRESCSEPSTGRKKASTLHTSVDANPTHYRYSSIYIQLLNNVQIQDEQGKWWKFDLKWSASVPTYIQRLSNWRQVHWLAEKVEASPSDKHLTFDELLENVTKTWINYQQSVDELLDNESESWTHKIVGRRLNLNEKCSVLSYNPRNIDLFTKIDCHNLIEDKNVNIWNVETNPFAYRTSLTKATELKDRRYRAGWNSTFSNSINYLKNNKAEFEAFIGTEVLSHENKETIENLTKILKKNSKIYLLEPVKSEESFNGLKQKFNDDFKIVKTENITSEVVNNIQEYIQRRKLDSKLFEKSINSTWMFVEVELM